MTQAAQEPGNSLVLGPLVALVANFSGNDIIHFHGKSLTQEQASIYTDAKNSVIKLWFCQQPDYWCSLA